MRIIDLARDLQLSYTTVSLTLSGKGNRYGISKATQARILAYAEKVGYVKDVDAARVAAGAADQIGILCPSNPAELNENQHTQFFMLLDVLHELALTPIIQPVDRESFMVGVRYLLGKKVNAIVAIGSPIIRACITTPKFAALVREKRVILADYKFTHDGEITIQRCYRVGYDRREATLAMLATVREAGHRVVAVHENLLHYFRAAPPDIRDITLLRLRDPAGRGRNLYQNGELSLPDVLALMRERGCTAAMMNDDMKAVGLITALCNAGYRVPEDISVTGFEGIPSAEYARVPLATVQVPTADMIQAIRALLMADQDGDTPADDTLEYRLPCTVVARASLGILRQPVATE